MSIITYPAKILTLPTRKVQPSDPARLEVGADLLIELDRDPGALAVAAPQIGSSLRMFAFRQEDGALDVLVNPAIVESRGKRIGRERCLSFPDQVFMVVRPQAVVVHAVTLEGDDVRLCWHDKYARMACHEVDHLDGVLVIDRVKARDALKPRPLTEVERDLRDEALR